MSVYELRYNEVSMKASHNTYRIDAPLVRLSADGRSCVCPVLDNDRCRSLELDVNQSPDGTQWSVEHDSDDYQLHHRQLSQFLAELRAWSQLNPDHDVVTLLLCLKGVLHTPAYPAQLDSYIRTFLGVGRTVTVFTPAMLLGGGAQTLADGARTVGWPRLRDLAGTFVIILSGAEDVLRMYAAEPTDRLAFADIAFDGGGRDDTTPPAPDPNRIFLNYCLTAEHAAIWTRAFSNVASDPAIILRGYTLNDAALFTEALDAGVHLLATDDIATDQVSATEPFVRRRTLAAVTENGNENDPTANA